MREIIILDFDDGWVPQKSLEVFQEMLNDGWEIERSDTAESFIVYILRKSL